MRTPIQSLALVILFLSFPVAGFCWNATGHMTIARIAYERLTPKTKAEVDRLIAMPIGPEGARAQTADFFTAAVWADDVRNITGNGPMHYRDTPMSLDGSSIDRARIGAVNVVTALEGCEAAMRDPATSDTMRAEKLRYMLHFMGDIHQPLHCTTLVSKNKPEGDKGGNDFQVSGMGRIKNLHSLWDGGCGLTTASVQRPLDAAGLETIKDLAHKITAEVPAPAEPVTISYDAITAEGFAAAKQATYADIKNGDKPTAQYLTRGWELAEKRIALAGYRLAEKLNSIFDPQSQKQTGVQENRVLAYR